MTGFWRPQSLDELQSFIDNGLAEESHFLEFKEAPPANKGIARQLAAFSVDGGELVFGVAERQSGVFTIEPLEHAGLPERIDQIAQAGVDRPLPVESRLLPEGDDPTRAVLWVSIPPSPEAPHQVDGTYYKRSGKQTLPMSDAEVERLIRSRRTTLDGIESKLRAAMAEDTDGNLAHIFGVARPLGAAPDELYNAIGGASGWEAFGNGIRGKLRPSMIGAPGPDRYTLSTQHHNDRARATEGSHVALSLFDDGAIRWFSEDGSLVDPYRRGDGRQYLVLASFVDACLSMVIAMRAVAKQVSHRRPWDVAIGVTHTRGLTGLVYSSPFDARDHVPPFPDDDYVRVKRVGGLQLEKDEWDTVRPLTHGFVEGCGFSFEAVAKQLGYARDAP